MCGIVGVLNLQDGPPVLQETLLSMLCALRHRGPDGFGIFRDPVIGVGNARLSIIDLNTGDQPIANEDESLWIVFNGEIFNYVELRPELEVRGHHFTTQTDTEVILHLYEEYGPGCLEHLNGQFAFAIWDTLNRQLFLARDRLGVRPLYYTIASDQLVFASEIKAILAHPAVRAEIDPDSLAQVFTFWSVQPPRSIFRGIHELPPGCCMFVRDGQHEVRPYWTLQFAEHPDTSRPTEDYLDELESLLVDATVVRLRADVPVGAYLSGGLDSSMTTAMIRRYTPNRLDTFSIAFSDPQFDESPFQQQMADFLGTDHRVVYCTHKEIGEVFPEVIWHTEAPILRTAPAPMFLLSRLVNDHRIKVVVTGEGSDELLGGYDIFKEMVVRRFWARNPESTLRPRLLKRLYPDISGLTKAGWSYLTAFYKKDLTQTDSPYYSHQVRWRNANRLQRFLSMDVQAVRPHLEESLVVPLPEGFLAWPHLAQAQYLEITTFLSPYLLSSQGDRMAMAHSVEGRYPFLDKRVVDFCTRTPSDLKLYGLNEKYLLRVLGRKYLPEEIYRRPKRPYRAPIHDCFFGDRKPAYVDELLSETPLAESGLFNPQTVTQLVRKAAAGAAISEADDMALVGILSTQLVFQQFVKSFPIKSGNTARIDRAKIIDRFLQEN